jgi:hypothetical protein
MAITEADLLYETSTTTGTGTLNLDGAASSEFRTFVAGIGTGNKCRYKIRNRAAAEWEIGIGTVTDASPDTLSRTTVTASSNAGALVDFSAGTKEVECVRSANATPIYDENGNVGIGETVPGTLFDMAGASPYLTTHCTTHTDSDGARISKWIAEGEQSGGELTTLGELEFSHDGASDDEKGKFVLRLNDGNDGTSPTAVITALSSGNVGIGTNAPTYKLTVSDSTTETLGAAYAQSVSKTVTSNVDSSALIAGITSTVSSNGGGDFTNTVRGLNYYAKHSGTGTLADLRGSSAFIELTSSGAITDAYIYFGQAAFSAASTTIITNSYGFFTRAPYWAGAGGTITNNYAAYLQPGTSDKITNNYGLYIATPTAATGINRALHVAGGASYFGGNVGIGTTTPASLFEVQGGLTTTGAVVTLSSKETSTVDGDVLGRINFRAALDAAGGDAILAGASIWAEADDTFSSTVNNTELVFGTATTSVAIEYMRLLADGGLKLSAIKSGATQVAAGAEAGELWRTVSHATLPDNVVMIGA